MPTLARTCLLAVTLAAAVAVPGAQGVRADRPAAAEPAAVFSVDERPRPRPAPPTLGERAVRAAAAMLGVPYRYGGTSPAGFDCSGLVRYAYGKVGVELPHNAAAQFARGRPVARGALEVGDLVFFHGLGHVGLYAGGGRVLHAPQSGGRVEVVPLAGHYASRLDGARRLVPA